LKIKDIIFLRKLTKKNAHKSLPQIYKRKKKEIRNKLTRTKRKEKWTKKYSTNENLEKYNPKDAKVS